MRKRDRYYLVDPRRRTGAAVLAVRWAWLARLVTVFLRRLDYGRPGVTLLKVSGGAR